jgi:hypothetical protein
MFRIHNIGLTESNGTFDGVFQFTHITGPVIGNQFLQGFSGKLLLFQTVVLTDVLQNLAQDGKASMCLFTGTYFDCGSENGYASANMFVVEHKDELK